MFIKLVWKKLINNNHGEPMISIAGVLLMPGAIALDVAAIPFLPFAACYAYAEEKCDE